jgi:hypothetical protein
VEGRAGMPPVIANEPVVAVDIVATSILPPNVGNMSAAGASARETENEKRNS